VENPSCPAQTASAVASNTLAKAYLRLPRQEVGSIVMSRTLI